MNSMNSVKFSPASAAGFTLASVVWGRRGVTYMNFFYEVIQKVE